MYFTELPRPKLSVGKIYAGLLILESWRTTRFGQIESSGPQVNIGISKSKLNCWYKYLIDLLK